MGKSIHLEGFEHVAPIPTAARVGPLLISSAIGGQVVGAGQQAALKAQVAHVFEGIEKVLAAGGCEPADVVSISFTVEDRGAKDEINVHWSKMFPSEDDRPARHVTVGTLPGGLLVQAEVIAYRAEGRP